MDDSNKLTTVIPEVTFKRALEQEYNSALGITQCRMRLLQAHAPEHLLKIALEIVNEAGFSDVTFTRLNGRCDPDAHLVSTPAAISREYKRIGVWGKDRMMNHAKQPAKMVRGVLTPPKALYQTQIDHHVNTAPHVDDDILSARACRSVSLRMGYRDYYGVTVLAGNGNGNNLVAITSKGMSELEFKKRTQKYHNLFQLLGEQIDFVCSTKFADLFLEPDESRVIQINPRPLEVLTLMAKEGLRPREIAERLNLVEGTVNAHISAAQKALGADTNAHAVYLAIKHKVIAVDY